MPEIQLCDLTKRFGEALAVDRASLEVHRGEHLGIVGPSGAGKTTLLRLIAGLDVPDAGHIVVPEQVEKNQPLCSYVTQDYALYPNLSVSRNLLAPWPRRERKSLECSPRYIETVRWFGLEPLLQRRPHELSGGQCQRVALAKALLRQPRLLLLDEPFSQIDIPLRAKAREFVRAAVDQFQTTVVLVTHDLMDAMMLSKRIAAMEGGRIVQVDQAVEVYRQPASRGVAELLSPYGVNWFPAGFLSATQQEEWGVRPESIELWPADHPVLSEPSATQLEGTLVDLQPLGFAMLARLDVYSPRSGAVMPLSGRLEPEERLQVSVVQPYRGEVVLRVGSRYRMSIPPDGWLCRAAAIR